MLKKRNIIKNYESPSSKTYLYKFLKQEGLLQRFINECNLYIKKDPILEEFLDNPLIKFNNVKSAEEFFIKYGNESNAFGNAFIYAEETSRNNDGFNDVDWWKVDNKYTSYVRKEESKENVPW